MKTLLCTITSFFVAAGCVPAVEEPECRHSLDCSIEELCIERACVSTRELPAATRAAPERHANGSLDVVDLGDGVDAASIDSGGVTSSNFCTDAVAPKHGTLVINEFLANPPTGSDGDANGDGERDPYDDEFVEIVNVADETVELTGVRIYSGESMRFKFEPLCLKPGDAVVVFGGGYPSLDPAASVIASESRLKLSNEGGVVRVIGPAGLVDEARYGPAPPASLTLSPELAGSRYVDHRTVGDERFSPGFCVDGRPTVSGCPPPDEPAADMGGD